MAHPAVVVDLGEAFTKIGFAGDAHPAHIFKTVMVLSSGKKVCPLDFLYVSQQIVSRA